MVKDTFIICCFVMTVAPRISSVGQLFSSNRFANCINDEFGMSCLMFLNGFGYL